MKSKKKKMGYRQFLTAFRKAAKGHKFHFAGSGIRDEEDRCPIELVAGGKPHNYTASAEVLYLEESVVDRILGGADKTIGSLKDDPEDLSARKALLEITGLEEPERWRHETLVP